MTPFRKRLIAALCGVMMLLGTGFLTGWAASRRLSLMSYHDIEKAYLTEPGDASPEVRHAVVQALRSFQEGYLHRDLRQLDGFMEQLFPREAHLLVAGTETGEWRLGFQSVKDFIHDDWATWGDVRLNVDEPIVCAQGDVAWLITVGTVGPEGAARPIRFSAVLTRAGNRWQFRHIQFQWDVGAVPFRQLFQPRALGGLNLQ